MVRSDVEMSLDPKLKLQIIHSICFTCLTVRHRESVTEKYNNLTIIDFSVIVQTLWHYLV